MEANYVQHDVLSFWRHGTAVNSVSDFFWRQQSKHLLERRWPNRGVFWIALFCQDYEVAALNKTFHLFTSEGGSCLKSERYRTLCAAVQTLLECFQGCWCCQPERTMIPVLGSKERRSWRLQHRLCSTGCSKRKSEIGRFMPDDLYFQC